MKITICGSLKFVDEIRQAKTILEKLGHDVIIPRGAELNQGKSFWKELKAKDIEEFKKIKVERTDLHFSRVKEADAILVLNYDKDGKKNYIGPATLMEIGIAHEHGKKIFVLNKPLEDDVCYEEMIALSSVFLGGNLENLRDVK